MDNDKNKHIAPEARKIDEALERQKIAAQQELLAACLQFVKQDLAGNALVLRLAEVAVKVAEDNPNAVFSSRSGNLTDVINALKAGGGLAGGQKEGDVRGGDIVGGDAIDDIIKIIDALINLITGGEKEFFLAIIKLIFCGC